MCAVLTKGYSFGASETVTNAKLHSLVDSATISGITGTEITDGTITSAKFGDIEGSKLTTLNTISAGAGVIPAANLISVAQKGANSDITSLVGLSTPLPTNEGGTGSTANANSAGGVVVPTGAVNAANGVVVLDASAKLVVGQELLQNNILRVTADQASKGMTVNTSWQNITSLTITVATNELILIIANGETQENGSSCNQSILQLLDGSTLLGMDTIETNNIGNTDGVWLGGSIVTFLAPTAASHTYYLQERFVGLTDVSSINAAGRIYIMRIK